MQTQNKHERGEFFLEKVFLSIFVFLFSFVVYELAGYINSKVKFKKKVVTFNSFFFRQNTSYIISRKLSLESLEIGYRLKA